jgi:putative Holliday junction resolvase
VQEKQTINYGEFAVAGNLPPDGRVLSIDPGKKRIGVAVSDENRLVCRPLQTIERTSWKKLLSAIQAVLQEFDAKALVVGLPLESDGSESPMSAEARDLARKFALSLGIPVFLQDERVSSYEARKRLWSSKRSPQNLTGSVDSEAAAVILSDFIDRTSEPLS